MKGYLGMYNTLYDDDNHGLEVWREQKARQRALRICTRVGIRISSEYLDTLDIKQVRRIIREGLGVLEAMDSLSPVRRAAPERRERRGRYA